MKRAFYGVFSLLLVAILTVVIRYPQDNLIPARIFLYMLAWVIILCGIREILSFLEKLLTQKDLNVCQISRIGLIIYAVCYGVGIYIVSLILRSYPVTDYGYLYQTAYNLATGQAVENWEYFSMWTNNLGSLTILTFCMRLGVMLGFADPYYLVLGLNVLYVTSVLLSLYYLAGKIGEKSFSRQWFTVAVFSLWMPVWACTNSFYSDQLSFGGSIIAVALWLYACDLRRRGAPKVKTGAILLFAGAIWGISIVAKATSAVAVVAAAIILLLTWKRAKSYWKNAILLCLAMALTVGALSAVSDRYPSKEDEYRLKAPIEYWFAMGLIGNGTYADNEYLVQQCNYSQNIDERKAFCREMIAENWKNMFQVEHLTDKSAVIFASGKISPTSHIYPYKESLLWHWVYWEGDYYWKYACLTTSFFYAILLLMLCGTFLWTFEPGNEDSNLVFMFYLTVFGLFLFLMFWEAQNKQLYNHIPWMTLAAVCGLEKVRHYIKMRRRNKNA